MTPSRTVLRCVIEFTRAIEVLNRTVFEIEKMYDVSLPLLLDNENLMVEIESERVTVCCLLDQNLVCTSSFLLCDDGSDLAECIEYCNSNYDTFGCACWILPNCRIEHIPIDEPCLMFIPQNKTTVKIEKNSGGVPS